LDEQLVDLLIAAEALFLSDVGSGELTYRLATRAAFFLAERPDERREVSDLFKRAYSQRSKLVHGEILEVTAEPGYTPREFVKAIEDAIRAAVTRCVLATPDDMQRKAPADWDALIFGRIGAHEPQSP